MKPTEPFQQPLSMALDPRLRNNVGWSSRRDQIRATCHDGLYFTGGKPGQPNQLRQITTFGALFGKQSEAVAGRSGCELLQPHHASLAIEPKRREGVDNGPARDRSRRRRSAQ